MVTIVCYPIAAITLREMAPQYATKEFFMTRLQFIQRAAVVLIALLVSPSLRAASPITYTTIHVQDMHCGECAKTIARKLYALPGVVEVRADVSKNLAYVVPQKDKTVGSKAIWEAVESAGFRVVKLESPQGVYTAKPR
jgi:copper chaperone CopZ